MFSKIKTMNYTANSLNNDVKKAKKWIKEADCIVIGAGAGLSASGGLSYVTEDLVKEWYPEYYKMGFSSIFSILGHYWNLQDSNPQRYWGYWARHIKNIRYDYELMKPYQCLYDLVKDKDYFIISTNADGQFEKSEFPAEKIFAPQGNYSYFQCIEPCSDEIYDNKEMVETMINNMVSEFEIDKKDIPMCPKCGKHLVPNLRKDDTFVEKYHMRNISDYENYINGNADKKVLFIELGVGYNSPGVIRYPFEIMTQKIKDAKLLRLNKSDAVINKSLGADKALAIGEDITTVLERLV